MCYDISFTVSIKQLADYFPNLIFDDQLELNFELMHQLDHIVGHSYAEHPIIYIPTETTEHHCKLMEWGIIPFYTKDESAFKKQRATMLNIRSERILEDKSSYWYKIRNRRCLVPITGFYEHREVPGFKNKIPYYLQLKEQAVFFVPGLYSVVELPDKSTGEMIKRYTYGIITRAANDLMKQVHNGGENKWRMPLLLDFAASQKWLQYDLTEESYREILNFEMPATAMTYRSVYTIRSAKMRPDEKEKTDLYVWGNLPEIKD